MQLLIFCVTKPMKYKGSISDDTKKLPVIAEKKRKTIEERLTPLSEHLILGLTLVLLMTSMLSINQLVGNKVQNGSLNPTVFIKRKEVSKSEEMVRKTFVRSVPFYEGLSYEYSYYEEDQLFDRYLDSGGKEVLYHVED